MKRIYIAILIVVLLIVTPIVGWFLLPSKQLNVAIIDKTVPNEQYREHLGVTWALNHFKYEHSNGMYNEETDYFGTVPLDESIEPKPLPTDYSNYDVIYLADTYGVYEDDLKRNQDRSGAQSKKRIGGLEKEEWNHIMTRLVDEKESLFIAEYNSIASPTSEEVRNEVLEYLEMNWTGWIGRYFDELNAKKNKEIPQWIVDDYGESWSYEGGGFILVNDFTNEVLVLELGQHVNEPGIRLQFTEAGESYFDSTASPKYKYWFDIVTASQQDNVLATYDWDLTSNGQKIIKEHDIPASFTAVAKTERKNSTAYYFAGDFNDMSKVPAFFQMRGLSTLYKWAQTFSDESFYWSAYVPMMEKILDDFSKEERKEQKNPSNLNYNARISDQGLEVLVNEKWQKLTLKGVNIGMGEPGAFPGEAAISEEDYYRWFKQIGEMNANTIRVYTLQPTGFYQALERYNQQTETPLYVLHGVWIEEEALEETLDAYNEETLQEFQEEMKTIVDVVHGNKYVKPRAGHASGLYDADISEYVIGWIIGIEWYPYMVQNTNKEYAHIGQYDGEYFQTKGADPFEVWLAEQMDYMTQYEQQQYEWIRPISFTNWVTTDLLDHPSEPSPEEDMVGVDPNVIYTKGLANETGQFASYHVYPYYPDFLNYDETYLNYVDHRGNKNSYAGYLADLRAAHRMPVLIAEFGIPSSRGLTHDNPYGWTQGNVSEQEQGEILTHLFEDIMEQGYMGGLVFTWQDEWFKRTWNTMDYDNPDRRPFWSNAQTNEQQFGLLSFDRHKIKVDGDVSEWEAPPLYDESTDNLSMAVDYDERYLYIQLKGEGLEKASPQILLDVVPNQGKTSKSDIDGVSFTNGVDFVAELNKEKESRIVVDPYYDYHSFFYGHLLKLIDTPSVKEKRLSHTFNRIYYALNKQLFLPATGEILPFSAYETGKLKEGNANPTAESYDSLVDFSWNENVIELRIPWLLIQSKDPSRREFMGDFYTDGEDASIFVDEIYLGVLLVDEQGEVVHSLPKIENDQTLGPLESFTWDVWEKPLAEERLKESYYILQETFRRYE